MGYKVYIQKFENGDPASIPYNELAEILEKYGDIINKRDGVNLPLFNGYL